MKKMDLLKEKPHLNPKIYDMHELFGSNETDLLDTLQNPKLDSLLHRKNYYPIRRFQGHKNLRRKNFPNWSFCFYN